MNSLNKLPQTNVNIDQSFKELYPEIKKIAQSQLNKLKPGQTITATVLVNECYLKLSHKMQLIINNDKHLYCIVARCMKQLLIDELRNKKRIKRSAELQTNLVSQIVGADGIDLKFYDLIMAIDELKLIDGKLAEIVELHCFGGFTFDELAKVLNRSKRQLLRRWQLAKTLIISLIEESND